MLPHPCWILQQYTIFGESDMNPSTILKSPSNKAFLTSPHTSKTKKKKHLKVKVPKNKLIQTGI
uniref:Putative ovule protein n=1 Tax=Solanum chacoense TaxID=4108 RepID=A0A0V0H539_SOLCH